MAYPPKTKPCLHCSKEFTALSGASKFCSKACTRANYAPKQKAAQAKASAAYYRLHKERLSLKRKLDPRTKEKTKAWYEANKDTHSARVLERKKRLRLQWREFKATLQCSRCEERHPACLEFHHLDPHTKLESVGKLSMYASMETVQAEIQKCMVLCSNCHRKEHWKAD